MDNEMLRKVQAELLGILKSIDKVCKENSIQYFLDSGTLIGAIRHHGFIPWDDDLDIGMLREDYEKFNKIAQMELGDSYFWQTWETDPEYAMPFGKVRKKNTIYLEMNSHVFKENGFFVDILPYDFAPEDLNERALLKKNQKTVHRKLLMKSGYKPWIVEGKKDYKRRLGYIPYQVLSLLSSRDQLINQYNSITFSVSSRKTVYEQTGRMYYPLEWMRKTILVEFEGEMFPAVSHYHEWLTTAYGDYMTPPPEDQRENRHQIYKIDFGK